MSTELLNIEKSEIFFPVNLEEININNLLDLIKLVNKESDWILVESENVYIRELFKNDKIEIIEAKINPFESMKTHFHQRPNDGVEIYVFHQTKKKFVLFPQKEDYEINEPTLHIFYSGEKHGIKNMSNEPLRFYAVYSPPFEEGESKLCE